MIRRALFFGILTLVSTARAQAAEVAPVTPPGAGPGDVLRRVSASPRGPTRLPDVPIAAGPDRTLAPYFVVPGEGDGERLPLEETRADVAVAGPIAQVKVTQTFRNRGPRPIEAIYVFPASTRAAVHGMRLRIGERTVEARIERRAKARADYEAARTEGRRAALLDEERPNLFTMRVANVMPGDRLVAELDYSELVVPEQGVYELVYPAVVGPRYGGGADPARDGWLANPYLHQGEAAPYRFGFTAHVEAAVPVKELSSPSHELDVSWRSPRSADVTLRGQGGGDRDVVLRWRLAGDAIEAGAMVFPGEGGEGWFLAAVEPPARVAPDAIPPREYVFVLDVSGSMHGFPLDTAKALMRSLLPRLRPVDRFNVVFFSGGSFVLSPGESLAATPANVKRALDTFDRHGGGGGTELLQALETAYGLPRADRRIARSVVVVTDGYVAVEAAAFRLVRERLDEASCFAFGIGSSVNRALVEALARAGQGEATVVLSPEEAPESAGRLERILAAPVLSQLRYRVEGLDARDVLPGALPDLLAERPVVLLGRFRGAPRGRVVVEGMSARGPFRKEIDLGAAAARSGNAPLRVLWARRWVELLLDEHHLGAAPELEEAVTALGLAHRILTPFTSFVAVDSEVVNRGGAGESVKQPLPLPQGVSDLAVAESIAPAPPAAPLRGALGGASAPGRYRREAARKSLLAADAAPASPEPKTERERDDRAAGTPTATPALRFEGEAAANLTDAAALRAAIRSIMEKLARDGLRGEFELRVTIDAAGSTRVEVLRGPGKAARARVERALRGLASSARPAAAGPATYRVTVAMS
jgi:Ca-activated chloride channel family protein